MDGSRDVRRLQIELTIAKAVQLRELDHALQQWWAVLDCAQSFSNDLVCPDGSGRLFTPPVLADFRRARIGFSGAAGLAVAALSDQPVEVRAETPVERFDVGVARLCTPPALVVCGDDFAEPASAASGGSSPAGRGPSLSPGSLWSTMEFISQPSATPGGATPPRLPVATRSHTPPDETRDHVSRRRHLRLLAIDSPTRPKDLNAYTPGDDLAE
jgi:hypothetical protein